MRWVCVIRGIIIVILFQIILDIYCKCVRGSFEYLTHFCLKLWMFYNFRTISADYFLSFIWFYFIFEYINHQSTLWSVGVCMCLCMCVCVYVCVSVCDCEYLYVFAVNLEGVLPRHDTISISIRSQSKLFVLRSLNKHYKWPTNVDWYHVRGDVWHWL